MMLFWKECRKILFSLTFLIYVVAMAAHYLTQFHPDADKPLHQPVPGMEDYGYKVEEDPDVLMPEAAEGLLREYLDGSYTAYPIGFYKNVHLSAEKTTQMAAILTELTGLSREEIEGFDYDPEGSVELIENEDGSLYAEYIMPEIPAFEVPETLTYARFRELMTEADRLIGGGSEYSDGFLLECFSLVPMTYEEALAEYQDIVEKDRVTGAFARLFCDYMGIMLAILPVFVAAALAHADRKSRMEQLVYSRSCSTIRLVLTRYGALVTMMLLPILGLAAVATLTVALTHREYAIDPLGIVGTSLYWLLPNLLFSTALGMLLTELISPLAAIFVEGVMWFGSVMMGSAALSGGITKFILVPRHNTCFERMQFMTHLGDFTFNRVFYTVLSVLLLAAAVAVYHKKREGALHVPHFGR